MRYVAAGGQAWVKTGAADTAWSYVDPTAGAAPAYGMLYTYHQGGTTYNFTGNANVWTKQASGFWQAVGPASGCTVNVNGNITLPARASAWRVAYGFDVDNETNVTAYHADFSIYVNAVAQAHTQINIAGPASWDSSNPYADPRLHYSMSAIVVAASSDVISLYGRRNSTFLFPSNVYGAHLTVTELR
jgi:hypothetical protein